jgi:hypothetical protein
VDTVPYPLLRRKSVILTEESIDRANISPELLSVKKVSQFVR